MSAYPDTNSIVVGATAIVKGRAFKLGSAGDAAKAVPFAAATDTMIGVALHSADPGERLAYAYAGMVDVEVDAPAGALTSLLTTNAAGQFIPQAASGSQTAPTRAVLREPGVDNVGSRLRYTEVSLLAVPIAAVGA